jgi:hypothetical protein
VSVPDLAEPITAYRWIDPHSFVSGDIGPVWAEKKGRFTRRIQRIVTEPKPVYWGDGQVTAKCPMCESSPGKNCPISLGDGCGIYAYKFPYRVSNVEVQLWGKVFEYEYGYRAEHAQITGIVSVGDVFSSYNKNAFSSYNKNALRRRLGDLPVRHVTDSSVLSNEMFRRWDREMNYGVETEIMLSRRLTARPYTDFNRFTV